MVRNVNDGTFMLEICNVTAHITFQMTAYYLSDNATKSISKSITDAHQQSANQPDAELATL